MKKIEKPQPAFAVVLDSYDGRYGPESEINLVSRAELDELLLNVPLGKILKVYALTEIEDFVVNMLKNKEI